MTIRIGIALAAALIGAAVPRVAHAQRLEVSGGGVVTIGDSVTLMLRATLPAGAIADGLPHPRDSLPSSVRLLSVDSLRRRGDNALLYRARIALYQVGSLTSPAFALTYHMPEQEQPDSVVSGAVLVTVIATLPDTAVAMRDIRPLAPLGGEAVSHGWMIFIAALVVATLVALAVRARRGAVVPDAAALPPVQPLTAYETARARLDEIRRAGWSDADVARHYDEAADVLRRYLEGAHGVPAVRRTTPELLRDLPDSLRVGGAAAELGALLGEADLVKFARFRPRPRAAAPFLARIEALLEGWHAAPAPPPPVPTDEASHAIR